MLPDAYIKKNGCIYGHRSRYIGNGNWVHEFKRFTNAEKAVAWTKEGDFGYKRELISKSGMREYGAKLDEKGRILEAKR